MKLEYLVLLAVSIIGALGILIVLNFTGYQTAQTVDWNNVGCEEIDQAIQTLESVKSYVEKDPASLVSLGISDLNEYKNIVGNLRQKKEDCESNEVGKICRDGYEIFGKGFQKCEDQDYCTINTETGAWGLKKRACTKQPDGLFTICSGKEITRCPTGQVCFVGFDKCQSCNEILKSENLELNEQFIEFTYKENYNLIPSREFVVNGKRTDAGEGAENKRFLYFIKKTDTFPLTVQFTSQGSVCAEKTFEAPEPATPTTIELPAPAGAETSCPTIKFCGDEIINQDWEQCDPPGYYIPEKGKSGPRSNSIVCSDLCELSFWDYDGNPDYENKLIAKGLFKQNKRIKFRINLKENH